MEESRKWKISIDIDINQIVSGTVCIDHFAKDDLMFSRNGEIRLKKGGIPSIPTIPTANENNENHLVNQLSELNIDSDNSDQIILLEPESSIGLNKCCEKAISERDSIIANLKIENIQQRIQQQQYEYKIEELNEKVNEQRKKIKNLQDASYYLEKTKSKLKNTLLELKKDHNGAQIENILEV